MMDIKKLNKWSADKCGVILINSFDEIKCEFKNENGKQYWFAGMWNLKDARCMEIFREKFKVDTRWTVDVGWYCFAEIDKDDFPVEVSGKTIKEIELACAWAIMEAEK